MKSEKRTKLQIYFDILRLLCEELKSSNGLSVTRVAHKANLPYDRFRNCLDDLIRLGMVSRGPAGELAVTDKGLACVQEYRRLNDFLRRMGLLSDASQPAFSV